MKYLKKSLRNEVFKYVTEKYGSEIEYPWFKFPEYAVFRHIDNKKWFGLIMNIPYNKLGLNGDEYVDVLNVKSNDKFLIDIMLNENGIFPGYHLSKGNWLSVLLDGTVPLEKIFALIDESFASTASKAKKIKYREPKDWLVPANPKYYNIEYAFDNESVIDWKQGAGIITGDVVYMYVTAPVSAILYKCNVLETDIPCNFKSDKLNVPALMKIELIKKYGADEFTFERLKDEYGICAIRGPRGIPHSLRCKLN